MKKITALFTIALCTLLLMGCPTGEASTDQRQAKATEAMVAMAEKTVGMPNIRNFQERRFAKLIYELKDSEVVTYSYFMDMNGKLHLLCESVGYGLPASVQYVNPERIAKSHNQGGFAILPQPEPNGLFMPDGLDATYVLCTDGKGSVKPVYSEPKLIVSPFPLKGAAKLQ